MEQLIANLFSSFPKRVASRHLGSDHQSSLRQMFQPLKQINVVFYGVSV